MPYLFLQKIFPLTGLCLVLTSPAALADYNAANNILLRSIPQDTANYLPEIADVTARASQHAATQNYLSHYFEPWDGKKLAQSLAEIKSSERAVVAGFRKKPGIGANSLEHEADWVAALEQNMNLDAFPNLNMRAITVHNSNVRQLPSEDTSFSTWSAGGDGYPFDNLQTSFIAANTPVRVLHTSRDGSWYLILTANYYGWIPSYHVAFVDSAFINRWRSQPKLVPTQDIMVTARKISDPAVQLRVGSLYPQADKTKDNYQIYVAVMDSDHQALLKKVTVSKRYLTPFPLAISTKNAVKIANRLLGQPYGWGGMYGFRDCSATIMDLMATMGIWLPRNSADQARAGQRISLVGKTDLEKQTAIIKDGVPLFTLLHMPGHIMLYIGQKDGEAFIFHDAWPLHKTAVSSLQVQRRQGGTLLNRIDSMTNLTLSS